MAKKNLSGQIVISDRQLSLLGWSTYINNGLWYFTLKL
jgi:hypothetical protein